jgi:hypothetical protein
MTKHNPYLCQLKLSIMARLTSFSRLLIAAAIAAGLFFVARNFIPGLGSGASTTSTPTEVSTPTNTSNDAPAPTAQSTAPAAPAGNRMPFTYTPPVPSGGKLKGVVELGATGFNSFVVRIDASKNWDLEKAEFGASLIKENMATEDDIKKGLRQYINGMMEYGVGPKDIHFVVSSGAVKEEGTQKIISALKSMNYYVNTVTPEQEAKLAYRAATPRGYESRAFVVDIGSGNSKISWMEGGNLKGVESYGSKYFQNGADATTVYNDVSQKARSVPGFARPLCFIIGGVPFEMAKKIRNGDERYTVLLSPQDFKAEGEKQKAGANIYKAVADATGCKQFVFDWDANFTIGFLLNM